MRKNEDKKSSGHPMLYSILFGTAVGFLLIFILFMIFSAVIASGKVSENLMPYLTALSAVVGAAAGAVAAVKQHKGKLIILGLSVGALMFVVTFICSLFSGRENAAGSQTFILLVSFLAGGILGSFLSLKRKHKKHT